MPTRLSLIIPTFGRPRSAERAVRSVAMQNCPGVKIIVVDDGSSPPFRRPADIDVQVIRHETNRGPAAARNSGMARARGDWLSFLDDDDFLLPNTLQRRLAFAEDHLARTSPTLPIYASAFVEIDAGDAPQRIRTPRPARNMEAFASGCWFAPGSSILVRRQEFLCLVGPQEVGLRRLEDFEWFLRAALKGAELFIDPGVCVAVRRPASAHRADYRAAAAYVERQWAGGALPPMATKRLLAYLNLERSLAAFRESDWLEAAKDLGRSWHQWPRLKLHLSPGWVQARPGDELVSSIRTFLDTEQLLHRAAAVDDRMPAECGH